ncbi:23 kDa integral membrane protein-like [Nymphalis io]|uniref:23 kDa integral membrane protein-like n=1 Tax=Inachis io TaxID=171585 RepID=UPI002167689C|nr:23 kDa integral membrane protein-like [Nymphalis io]
MCLCLGACVVKYILIIINLILTLVGLAITALGIVVLLKVRNIEDLESDDLNLFPTLIIVIGCIITVIFFLGCCGAISRNSCMLISYSVITVIVASLTVGLTVFLSKNKGTVTDMFIDELSGGLNNTDAMVLSTLETSLKCCGTTGPDYYESSSLPVTCCPDMLSNIQNIQNIQNHVDFSSITNDININTSGGELCNMNNAFQEGCVTKAAETLKDVLKTVVTVLIFICIAEYVVAVMAMLYTCYIRRKK